jgi:hypothetical protein
VQSTPADSPSARLVVSITSDVEYAIVAHVVKTDDGSVWLRLDDAKQQDRKTYEQVRLFTILNCTEEEIRSCNFSDERLAELGHAIVARLSAQQQSGKQNL